MSEPDKAAPSAPAVAQGPSAAAVALVDVIYKHVATDPQEPRDKDKTHKLELAEDVTKSFESSGLGSLTVAQATTIGNTIKRSIEQTEKQTVEGLTKRLTWDLEPVCADPRDWPRARDLAAAIAKVVAPALRK